MAAVGDVEQLHRDAETVPGPLHGPLEHRADVQLVSDVPHVDPASLEGERGGSGHDPQVRQLCQAVGEFLGQAVAEVLLVARGRQVGERQDDEGRAGSGCPGRAGGPRGRRQEAVPALGDRLDVPRLIGVIVEQLSQISDRAAQDGFGDKPLLPDAVEDLVLGDDIVRMLRQEDQQVHQPGPQVPDGAVPGDPVEGRLDEPVAQREHRAGGGRFHNSAPPPRGTRRIPPCPYWPVGVIE